MKQILIQQEMHSLPHTRIMHFADRHTDACTDRPRI